MKLCVPSYSNVKTHKPQAESRHVWLNSLAEENASLRLNGQKDSLKALCDLPLVPGAKGNTFQRPSREKKLW